MKPRFVFISGTEGSGTTFLLRLLSAPDECTSLGGNHKKIPDGAEVRNLVKALDDAAFKLWDRALAEPDIYDAREILRKTLARIINHIQFASYTHFFLKRSSPFGRPANQHRPRLGYSRSSARGPHFDYVSKSLRGNVLGISQRIL